MRSPRSRGAHHLSHVHLSNLGNAVGLGQEDVAGLQVHVHHLSMGSAGSMLRRGDIHVQ